MSRSYFKCRLKLNVVKSHTRLISIRMELKRSARGSAPQSEATRGSRARLNVVERTRLTASCRVLVLPLLVHLLPVAVCARFWSEWLSLEAAGQLATRARSPRVAPFPRAPGSRLRAAIAGAALLLSQPQFGLDLHQGQFPVSLALSCCHFVLRKRGAFVVRRSSARFVLSCELVTCHFAAQIRCSR